MIRKFYLTTSVLIISLVFAVSTGWKYFQVNHGLKSIIISKLQSVAGERCSIDNVSMGLGAISLKGVALAFDNAPYELFIDELKLGYSIGSLLRSGTITAKTAESIAVVRPVLTIKYQPNTQQTQGGDFTLELTPETEEAYRALIREYGFIKKVDISDGIVKLKEEGLEHEHELATHISGWVYTDIKNKAWLRMAGRILSTNENNLNIYGQLDLERGALDYMNVELNDYQLNNPNPLLIPDYFAVKGGTANGHFTITEQPSSVHGFNIEGSLTLHDGSFKVKSENLYFEDVELDAELQNWNLVINNATQNINGSETELTGIIKNILHPELNLRLHSSKLNVKQFLTRLLPQKELPFSGLTEIDVTIGNTINNPEITGRLTSTNLSFYKNKLDSVAVKLKLDKTSLTFPQLFANFDRSAISGFGKIDYLLAEYPIDFEMGVVGDFTTHLHNLGFGATQNCSGTSKVRVFGPVISPVSTGEFNMNIEGRDADRLAVDGTFRYSGGQFNLHTSSADNSLQLTATIDSIFTRKTINFEASNLQRLFAFSNNPIVRVIKNRFKFNVAAEGRPDSMSVQLAGYKKQNYEKIFHVSSTYLHNSEVHQVENKIALLPNAENVETGEFTLTLEPTRTRLQNLTVGNWLTGEFDFCSSNEFMHTGKLNISGLKLPLLLSLLGESKPGQAGLLYGQVTLDGDCEEPRFSSNLWLLNAFLNDLGPLKGQFEFDATPAHIKVKKFILEDEEGFNLVAAGDYDFHTTEVDANIAGSHVRVEKVLDLFTETEGIVGGDAMIQVALKGKAPEIPIYGSVIVSNMNILMLKFDEAVLDFGTEMQANGSYVSSGFWNVGNAKLSKGDDFNLEGRVNLPLNNQSDIDLDLSGEGNFLALLPDIAEVFGESHSEGQLQVKMAGHYTKPNFAGSKLSITNGQFYLSEVTEKIDNIDGRFHIVDDDYFLDIEKLTATIEDKPIKISNSRTPGDSLQITYDPLRVAGDDLNLGTLFIETHPNGVPLQIPGLMDKGDKGWYAFDGYEPGENFFITGPWLRPVVRGKVSFHHANIMFPFDESGEGNPVVMNIMNNINWDVFVVPGKGTRYARQFPTGMYVNMEVDIKNSKLDFKGVLKDSTFSIGGKVESTRGDIEYLDLNFRVEKVGAEFSRSLDPLVYGKAWTAVRDTATNVPNDVFLTFVTVDNLTNEESNSGRWDRIQLRLSSENPAYEQTESDLMASLGYSSDTIDEQAKKVVGSSTDKLLFGPLLRPIERQLERRLSLDVVRFSYAIAQNFLDSGLNSELNSRLALLRSSRLILGKYLSEDLYLLYTGELKAGIGYQYQKQGVGLQHIVGLEYRLGPKWLLQMEYDYNTLLETHKDDKKVWLRHSFPF